MFKSIINIFLLTLTVESYAQVRFKVPSDPHARCQEFKQFDSQMCGALRDEGLEAGCITEEEAKTLENFGSAPSCSKQAAVIKTRVARAVAAGKDPKDVDLSIKFKHLTKQEKLSGLMTWCACGCFHPETKILTQKGEIKAKKILDNFKNFKLAHWGDDNFENNYTTEFSKIRSSTSGKEKDPLFVFQLENGRTLKVTKNHPILTSKKRILPANMITTKDLLLDRNSREIKILSIRKEKFNGKVINFIVEANNLNKSNHIIFSEGVATGDMYLQSLIKDKEKRIKARQ